MHDLILIVKLTRNIQNNGAGGFQQPETRKKIKTTYLFSVL